MIGTHVGATFRWPMIGTHMARIGVRLLLFIAILATIGCDRVTKHIASTTLADAPSRSFLADTFRLEYAENTGAFLSVGADWPRPVRTAVFGVGNTVLLAALTVVAVRRRWPRMALLGVALFVAGGRSDYLLPEHEPAIRGLFPRAHIVRIPDAGHWIHAERPQEFLEIVEEFLDA